MPPQRTFATETTESLMQRQGGFVETIEALVGFASQGEEVPGLGIPIRMIWTSQAPSQHHPEGFPSAGSSVVERACRTGPLAGYKVTPYHRRWRSASPHRHQHPLLTADRRRP